MINCLESRQEGDIHTLCIYVDLSADFVSLLVYVVVLLYIPPVASASQVFHLSITELLRNIFLLSRDVLTDPFPILLFTVLTYEEDFKMILLKKKRKSYTWKVLYLTRLCHFSHFLYHLLLSLFSAS